LGRVAPPLENESPPLPLSREEQKKFRDRNIKLRQTKSEKSPTNQGFSRMREVMISMQKSLS
jgi:hypothetical protein